MTIEEKIATLIINDKWFKDNNSSLVPQIGGYITTGNVYPSLAYNLTDGQSEPMIPASRSVLTFVMYGDNLAQTYSVLKKISLNIQRLMNRNPQNLCDLENGLRVVGCVKSGGESFFNKDINKHGRDLTFDIVMSDDFEESSSSIIEESESVSDSEVSSSEISQSNSDSEISTS